MAKFNPDKALARLKEIEKEIDFRLNMPWTARLDRLLAMKKRMVERFDENGYELVYSSAADQPPIGKGRFSAEGER